MPGCAITEVQIDGVLHEYSAMEGVQEDVIDILLNLKGVSVMLHSGDDAVITLSKKGAGAVTAADFQLTQDVEIVNPDHLKSFDTNANSKLNLTLMREAAQ